MLGFLLTSHRCTEPRGVQSECHSDHDNVAPTSDFFNRRPPNRRRYAETPYLLADTLVGVFPGSPIIRSRQLVSTARARAVRSNVCRYAQ